MPTKKKPKDWQPVGIDALKVEHLFPPNRMDELVNIVGVQNLVQIARLKTEIVNVAGFLNVGLQHERRPKTAEKKAALEQVQKYAEGLITTIQSLDADTKNLLIRVARMDPYNQQTEPDPSRTLFDLGAVRFSRMESSAEDVLRWAEGALGTREIMMRGKGGREREEAVQNAANSLAEVWKVFTGKEPTLPTSQETKRGYGPFLEFVRGVINPVLEANEKQLDLEHSARQAVYGYN